MAGHSFLTRIRPVTATSLRRLHPSGIEEEAAIRRLLGRVSEQQIVLWRGMNRRIDRETAQISEIRDSEIILSTKNFERASTSQIFLNFLLDERPYFFSADLIQQADHHIRIGLPQVIHRTERRDRDRREPPTPQRAMVSLSGRQSTVGEVADWSPEGLGLRLPKDRAPRIGDQVEVQLLDGSKIGRRVHAEVRNQIPTPDRPGWIRIGLSASSTNSTGLVNLERIEERARPRLDRARQRWSIAAAGVRIVSDRALARLRSRQKSSSIEIIDYENRVGERIRAIVDSWGPTRHAPVVVIPPAWGRTKETLMPLAECVVSAFRKANEPVAVIRFDGIRKRGESHNDSDCIGPGKDHHRFTFSQGVRDIEATLDFLKSSDRFETQNAILVSFSAAAIEARRAVAMDERIRGWVSVVGAPDLQSMMRVISGGIDYAIGLERGVRFGLQEILGVEVDMDFAGLDSFSHDLVYLEDARRDMARITVPVTWIRGRYDAWMDADRVRDVLSRGDTSNRRFIEVPTGHMLKTSREALDTFGVIVREVSRMALGREIRPVLPDLAVLEKKRRAERARLPNDVGDVRAFWRDYLLGRDSVLGIELMTSIAPYEALMEAQRVALELQDSACVADIGSGTGAFPLHLMRTGSHPVALRILELDYVQEGLRRARKRLSQWDSPNKPDVCYIESNLDLGGLAAIPLASSSCDAVLAGLFLSYIQNPDAALAEMFRVLKRGGRLVASSLRPDADMSKLYMDGIEELRSGRARELFGNEGERYLDTAARGYLNQASRLLDLEEKGVFHFRDAREMAQLVRRAGFRRIRTAHSLGSPPQAVIVSAVRP